MLPNLWVQSSCTNRITHNAESLLQWNTEKNGDKIKKSTSLSFAFFFLSLSLSLSLSLFVQIPPFLFDSSLPLKLYQHRS